MIEVSPQMYTYALFIVMNAMVLALILVVYFIRNIRSSVLSPSLFLAYFVLGEMGWLANAARAVSGEAISTANSELGFILCTYVLLLAVYKPFQRGLLGRILPLFHVGFAAFFYLVENSNLETSLLVLYSVATYAFIAWLCFKRASALRNIGHATLGTAAVVLIANAVSNLYAVLVWQDFALAGGLSTISLATTYTLIGIGFLSSILINEHKELALLSRTDPLTEIFNRRGLEASMQRLLSRSGKDSQRFSVITLDLDHFKNVNDTYGHEAGDLVLKSVARLISKDRRQNDICSRTGGEEFVIVLPDTQKNEASKIAESLREKLEAMPINVGADTIKVTASFGVACHENTFNLEAVLKGADTALYQAKQSGRNRVCTFVDAGKAA